MTTIPFDIAYREDIEAGRVKVVTRDGKPVKIVYWAKQGEFPIVALIGGSEEDVSTYMANGRYNSAIETGLDLFIVKRGIDKDVWYVCINDYYAGGKLQCKKGEIVQAKGGMRMMSLSDDDAERYFREARKDEIPGEPSDEFIDRIAQILWTSAGFKETSYAAHVSEAKRVAGTILGFAKTELNQHALTEDDANKAAKDALICEYNRGFEAGRKVLYPKWKVAQRDCNSDVMEFLVEYDHDGGDHDGWVEIIPTNRIHKGEKFFEISELRFSEPCKKEN